MTATEWTGNANALVQLALQAAQSKDNVQILSLEEKFLELKQQEVPDVPTDVDKAFRQAMFALNDAVVGNTVSDWATLKASLEASASALNRSADAANKAALLLSLQPAIDLTNSLSALVSDVKGLKTNPGAADVVAQKLQDLSTKLQALLSLVKTGS